MYQIVLASFALVAQSIAVPAAFDQPEVIHQLHRDADGKYGQQPMSSSTSHGDAIHSIPILTNQSTFSLIYNAQITVGTPPQPFSFAMDISLAELVVPSQDCKYFCPRTDHRYAHNESDTYLQVGGYHSVRWPGMNIGGYLSNDVLHLGGLDLEEMIFEEGTDFTCWAVGCQSEGYDGLLGLAGPWEPGTSSVLSVISRRKLVDRGIVSISLPKAKDGSKGAGELVLGAHRAREEDILWLPIHDNAAKYGWAVGADAMIFHTPTEMKLELPAGAVAVFSTTTSTLILPDEMVKNITKALGADQSTFFMSVVPCSQRSYMPDLTFILGGHEFTISAWEYIIEFETWSPQIGSICSVAIHPKSWYVGGEQNGIYLGSAFLRGFEWIGDWDRGRIGFAR